jgi:hypothetical protein
MSLRNQIRSLAGGKNLTLARSMGDDEGGAPYSWTSTEPLVEGQEEAPAGPWVKQAGKCVGFRSPLNVTPGTLHNLHCASPP